MNSAKPIWQFPILKFVATILKIICQAKHNKLLDRYDDFCQTTFCLDYDLLDNINTIYIIFWGEFTGIPRTPERQKDRRQTPKEESFRSHTSVSISLDVKIRIFRQRMVIMYEIQKWKRTFHFKALRLIEMLPLGSDAPVYM